MNDKYRNFDAERLFARKDNYCGFKYCPLCGAQLVKAEVDHRMRLKCPDDNCHYVFYQNPIPAAGAIIVDNDRVLMVKRAHPPKLGWWCFPAGFMEWDEHPEQTTVREVKEETGLEVELTSFFEVYNGHDDPRNNAILLLYLARIIGGKMTPGDDAEEVRYFSFDALPENIAFESHIQALRDYDQRFRKRV
ncbi:MAG: NUDIX domain-containing protein [Candidatus Zixiibacteriota bacterium]